MRQGLELICRQFLQVLDQAGCHGDRGAGQPLIPEKHNAVMHVEERRVGENTVVEVFQQGYRPGRQGPAVRHGQGSQLKDKRHGRKKTL